MLKPKLNYELINPASEVMASVRKLTKRLSLTADNGVKVRLSGSPALEKEELESVEEGIGVSLFLSLILVCSLLVIGLKHYQLVVSTILSLIVGLIITTAFAVAALSVAYKHTLGTERGGRDATRGDGAWVARVVGDELSGGADAQIRYSDWRRRRGRRRPTRHVVIRIVEQLTSRCCGCLLLHLRGFGCPLLLRGIRVKMVTCRTPSAPGARCGFGCRRRLFCCLRRRCLFARTAILPEQ